MNIDSKSVSYRLILKQFALQVGLLLITVLILFSFQNCSAPVAEDSSSSSSSGASRSAPFAFDTQIDHIAYLSCSGTSANSSLFTIKAGAYNAGSGLKLRDDFITATNLLSPVQKANLIAQSYENIESVHQMAIRPFGNYGQYQGAIGQFFGPLSSSPYVETLTNLAPGNRVNVIGGAVMESAINLSSSSETAHLNLRNSIANVANPSILTFTFSQPGLSSAVASPSPGSASSAYGRGFYFSFAYGGTVGGRALAVAYEGNLENNSPLATLSCSQDHVYKVVQFEHRGIYAGSTCATGSVANSSLQTDNIPTAGTAQRAAYDVVRKILPVSQWAVDGINRCISPKVPGVTCYSSGFVPSSSATSGQGYNSTPLCAGANCAQFLSVCKR